MAAPTEPTPSPEPSGRISGFALLGLFVLALGITALVIAIAASFLRR